MKKVFTILEIQKPDVVISAQSEPGTKYLAHCSKQVAKGEKWRGSLTLSKAGNYILVAESRVN
jgi:hypothetical protein